MLLFITIIHFIVALLLITLVLIQDSKGGGVFGMGGGGSNQIMSSTGAADFLVKATRALAIIFAGTCITLTYMTSRHATSVVDSYVPAPAASKPTSQVPTPGADATAPTAGANSTAPAAGTNSAAPAAGLNSAAPAKGTAPAPNSDSKPTDQKH